MRARLATLLLLLALPVTAGAQDAPITILQPGGGFLVADGGSKVPLEISLRDAKGPVRIRRANVRASLGRVSEVQVRGPGRVGFLYAPPPSSTEVPEMLDLELDLEGGDRRLEAFPIRVPAPAEPGLTVQVDPTTFDAERPRPVQIGATSGSRDADEILLFASHGRLEAPPPARSAGGLFAGATLQAPPDLPGDAPSHILIVGVARSPTGFSAAARGTSALARIRVRAEIPRGTQLVLEGAVADPEPVPAPADGYATIEGVVRYGATIRAFSVRGRRRSEVPIVVPSGLVPVGLAVPIPGQDVADGGTGPTVIVAVPPSPFGGEVLWPELEVEGAAIVREAPLSDDVKVLWLARPSERTTISVLADGVAIGRIELGAGHGAALEAKPAFARRGERAGVEVEVRDPLGTPTDRPRPIARIDGRGPALPIERTGPGRWRVSVPAGTPGQPDDELPVRVELPPPPVVAGDPAELAASTVTVRLEGPPPAIVAEGFDEPGGPRAATPAGAKPRGFAIGAMGLGGIGLGASPIFGGGATVEVRLPPLDRRFGLRSGFEYFHTRTDGKLAFGDQAALDVSAELGGVLVPFDLGFAVIKSEGFELGLRAGLELRFESAAVELEGEVVGGGRRFGIGARAGLEAGVDLAEVVTLVPALTVSGLGASASGLSDQNTRLDGALLGLRLDLGIRFWL